MILNSISQGNNTVFSYCEAFLSSEECESLFDQENITQAIGAGVLTVGFLLFIKNTCCSTQTPPQPLEDRVTAPPKTDAQKSSFGEKATQQFNKMITWAEKNRECLTVLGAVATVSALSYYDIFSQIIPTSPLSSEKTGTLQAADLSLEDSTLAQRVSSYCSFKNLSMFVLLTGAVGLSYDYFKVRTIRALGDDSDPEMQKKFFDQVKDGVQNNKTWVPDLVNSYVEDICSGTRKDYTSALRLAEIHLPSKNRGIQVDLLRLLSNLTHRGVEPAYALALQAATGHISDEKSLKKPSSYFACFFDSNNLELQKATLLIFNDLVYHSYNEAYDPALTAAQKYIDSSDLQIQERALAAFANLCRKSFNKAYNPALEAAQKYINSENLELRQIALLILNDLVCYSYKNAYSPALTAAQKHVNSSDLQIQTPALTLFGNLSLRPSSKASDPAFTAAQKYFNSENLGLRQRAQLTLNNLACCSYEKAYDLAFTAAQENIGSQDPELCLGALAIFGNLVKISYDKAYGPALKAAQDNINCTDSELRMKVLILLKRLSEKNVPGAKDLATQTAQGVLAQVDSSKNMKETAKEILKLTGVKPEGKAQRFLDASPHEEEEEPTDPRILGG